MKHHGLFRLRQLLYGQKFLWCIAFILGVITVLSALGLVMLAGWFITMASVAGLIAVGGYVLHYYLPSMMIRSFAIIRTIARYGDLMVSHHAVFGLLKDLRVHFFDRWARLPLLHRTRLDNQLGTSSQTMQRLVKDIDMLDEFPLRLISPFFVAGVSVILMGVLIVFSIPSAMFSVLCLSLSLCLAILALWRGVALAKRENWLVAQRKGLLLDTLPALTSLLIWDRWGEKVTQIANLDEDCLTLNANAMQLKRSVQALIQIVIATAVIVLLFVAGQIFSDMSIVAFSINNLNHYHALNPAVVLALTLGLFGLMEIVSMLIAEPLALGRSIQAKERINHLIQNSAPVAQKRSIAGDFITLTLNDISVKMPSAIIGANHINAKLTSDKPTLIVGASGAGKSTLLATIAGEIPLIGGEDRKSVV